MQNKDSKIYFVFGLHNHQPIGNLSSVFDKAFIDCYLPFLSTLEKFPDLKAVIHNSGALYDWAESKFPDWISGLQKLNQRGQIELVGGGYYEPIFPIITQKDRVGQIKLMNEYLEKTFQSKPKGCWVPERVWEQSLAKTLKRCGFEYTYLDEANFYLKKEINKNVNNLYLTEDQGCPLGLFSIDELLADKVPFIRPEEVIDILISYKKNKDIVVTFFCDGEKFGFWPKTHDLIYKKKWLEKFFTLLTRNPQIQTITSEEANNKFPQKSLVYIGSTTYPKMQKWALSYQENLIHRSLVGVCEKEKRYIKYRQFIKGGDFKNFFIKYPRLNFMHKRMLALAKKINANLDYKQDKEAFLNLWKAQTNCAYWHGIFGGFYLPHLRKACYDYLIKAEDFLDKKSKGIDFFREDIDFDGYKELILKTENRIYVFSQLGASLDELSLKNIPLNLVNTVNRVREPYHDRFKNHKFSRYLFYDSYQKTCLVDQILKKDLTIKDFRRGAGIYSLSGKFYDFSKIDGKAFSFSYKEKDISFRKEINLKKSTLGVEYSFDKKNALNKFDFGIEFNLSLSTPDNLSLEALENKVGLGEAQDLGKRNNLVILDKGYNLKLRFDFDQAEIYLNPIYTLSSSESGEDVLFQQLSILFKPKELKNSFGLELHVGKR